MTLPPELAEPAPPAAPPAGVQITEALESSLALRVPRVRELEPAARSAALEDFMLDSALVCSDLARERMNALVELAGLEDEWDDLQGWEHARRGQSQASVSDAKRTIRPDLARRIKAKRWLVARCDDEMARLEKDGRLVSRAYTPYTRM